MTKLTGRHYTIINYHLAGHKADDIARALRMTKERVSNVLCDPLTRAVIEQRFVEMDMELRALGPQAIRVLRDGMENKDPSIQLSAADKWFKSNGYYNPKNDPAPKATAEDLVRLLLAETQTGETTTVSLTLERKPDAISG